MLKLFPSPLGLAPDGAVAATAQRQPAILLQMCSQSLGPNQHMPDDAGVAKTATDAARIRQLKNFP